jgi:Icc-related predicted phosphoesterase
VRILHVSDIHGRASAVERLGRVIKSVDVITVGGDFEDAGVLDALAAHGKPVYAVTGNMDPPDAAVKARNYLIEGSVISIGGFYLAGYPVDASAVEGAGRRLILLAHYPPRGCRVDVTHGGEHIGSDAVRELVERVRPLAALVGHVHEAPGIDKLGSTVVVNPGPLSRGRYAVVEITGDGAVRAELGRV